jgi:hypothetical protein
VTTVSTAPAVGSIHVHGLPDRMQVARGHVRCRARTRRHGLNGYAERMPGGSSSLNRKTACGAQSQQPSWSSIINAQRSLRLHEVIESSALMGSPCPGDA